MVHTISRCLRFVPFFGFYHKYFGCFLLMDTTFQQSGAPERFSQQASYSYEVSPMRNKCHTSGVNLLESK